MGLGIRATKDHLVTKTGLSDDQDLRIDALSTNCMTKRIHSMLSSLSVLL